MAPYQSEDDLKYIDDLDDIPVSGFGIDANWSDQDDKLPAAQAGEEKLEGDVNDGREITNSIDLHGEAAAAWATYRLVLGMKAPDSTTRGDSLDEGEERMQFADRIRRMYEDLVETLTGATGFESEGGSGSVDFMVADW